MDISAIKPVERVLDIKHPATGEATGLKLTVCSLQDPRAKAVQRSQLDARLNKKAKHRSIAEIEREAVELLSSMVVGIEFTGKASWGGKKPEFSKEIVKEMLGHDWLRTQVDEFAGATEDFFEA